VLAIALAGALAAPLLAAASAAATPGIDATWGTKGVVGGQFSQFPRGVAANWSSGDVYVTDSQNNRIERFRAGTTFNAGVFKEAWGKDVDSANPSTAYERCLAPVGAEADHCTAGASGTLGGELSGPGGIAINQSSGNVYVIDTGNLRIQEFDENGNFVRAFGKDVVQTGQSGDNPAASAKQTLAVTASGGKYTLEFEGQKTGELPFNASAATIQAALVGLPSVGTGNLEVTGASSPFTITFKGALANNPEPAIVAASGAGEPLSGGTASVAVVTAGSTGFEICEAAAICKQGVSGTGGGAFGTFGGNGLTGQSLSPGSSLAIAPVGAPNQGDVMVADAGNRRIEEFTASGQFVRAFAWDVVAAGPDNKNFASGPDQANEVQAVTVRATAGQFRLKFGAGAEGVGETGLLNAGAGAGEVPVALNALTNVSTGGGSVAVTGGPGDATGSAPYRVTFNGGPLAGANVAQMSAVNAGLSGGTPSSEVTVATLSNGNSGFEVCNTAAFDACAAGSEGAGKGQFAGSTANTVTLDRIAEDKTGRIYTVEPLTNLRVQLFTLPANLPTPQGEFAAAALHGTQSSSAQAKDNTSELAVDETGFVYIAKAFPIGTGTPPVVVEGGALGAKWQQRILKIDPATEAVVATMAANPGLTSEVGTGFTLFQELTGLVAAPDGSRLYATTAESGISGGKSRVWRLGEITGLGASGIEAGEVGASTATLVAAVTPAQIPLQSLYRFEYSEDGLTWKRAPLVDAALGNGSAGGISSNCPTIQAGTCQVSQPIAGLVPGQAYQLRLVVYSLFDKGRAQTLAGATFTTKAAEPVIKTETAHWSSPAQTRPSLFLGATVNPGHERTTYHFEYVDDASYQADKASGGSGFEHASATAVADAGPGTEDVQVHEVVTGLDPTLVYHYRLVAANAVGTSTPHERDIAPASDSARYFELVSVGDSGGGGIGSEVGPVSDSGDRAEFGTFGGFGDPRSVPSILANSHISVRGPDGWSLTHTEPGGEQWTGAVGPLSPDLGGRLYALGTPAEVARGEATLVLARIDGSLQNLMTLRPLQQIASRATRYDMPGSSADFSRVFLKMTGGGAVTLLPGEGLVEKSHSNLYEASGLGGSSPALAIVNRADGKTGAVLGGACGASLAGGPHAVSLDGTTAYFTAAPQAPAPGAECPQNPGTSRLYGRLDGETTIEVSKTQCTRVSPPCHATGSGDLSAGAGSGTFTSGSKIVTGVSTETGAFAAGQTISATGTVIPANTTIAAVLSPTELELSAAAAGSKTGFAFTAGSKLVKNVATESGTFAAGMAITGAGIPNGATIAAVKSPSELELSAVATAAGTAVPLSGEVGEGDDKYKGASADGKVVFFTTTRPLTNSDEDSTADLYLYDTSPPAGQPNLVQVSAGEAVAGKHEVGKGAKVLGFLDNAENGSRVYFVAEGALAGKNPASNAEPTAGGKNLYVYERDAAHPTGRIAFVGALANGKGAAGDETEWEVGSTRGKSVTALPVSGSGSGDGHYLLLVSKARLVPSEDTDAAKDLYRYDDSAGTLVCLSCQGEAGAPAGAGNGNFDVSVLRRIVSGSLPDYAQQSRVASADLSTVVFATKERLSAEDENETWDAYAWHEGQIELISRGTGSLGLPENNELQVAVSPDGRNIFFTTQATLVGTDTNNATDLYDARVGGGFPEEARAPSCEDSQSCQGEVAPVPGSSSSSPGSESLQSGGNPAPLASCPAGKVRRGGKCVKKPAKRRHRTKKHRKRADHGRGGSR
jgi:NHL repeat